MERSAISVCLIRESSVLLRRALAKVRQFWRTCQTGDVPAKGSRRKIIYQELRQADVRNPLPRACGLKGPSGQVFL